jgi:hypothetical protein
MTPPTNPQLAQQIVHYLNDLLKLSPEAISMLIEHRVPCTQELADHPTVQAVDGEKSGTYVVGLLGILNGLCGCRSTGGGFIAAVINTDVEPPQVESFQLLQETSGPLTATNPNDQ